MSICFICICAPYAPQLLYCPVLCVDEHTSRFNSMAILHNPADVIHAINLLHNRSRKRYPDRAGKFCVFALDAVGWCPAIYPMAMYMRVIWLVEHMVWNWIDWLHWLNSSIIALRTFMFCTQTHCSNFVAANFCNIMTTTKSA